MYFNIIITLGYHYNSTLGVLDKLRMETLFIAKVLCMTQTKLFHMGSLYTEKYIYFKVSP